MDSPFFPLPDLSHVMGKSREELLAMAKELGDKKASVSEEVLAKEGPIISTKDEIEEPRNEASAGGSSPTSTAGPSAIPKTSVGGTQKPSVEAQAKDGSDGVKVEDRSIGGKKPRITAEEGHPVMEFSGYNAKRHEFKIEYDNDAEQLLADMEFKDTDTEAEREIKLRVLRIYSRRLDERKRRKDFIIERNLLFPDPFLKSLSPEERELCQQYRVFMRFHLKEEHEELLKNVVEEHRIVKRIKDLQEARAAGCRTSSEADRYIGQKRRREAEEDARRVKESVEAGPSGKILLRVKSEFNGSPRGNTRGPSSLDTAGKNTAITCFLDEWDLTGFPGVDLLSGSEKRLCQEMKILPSHYLNMIKVMSMEIMKGNITKRSDAYGLFKVDTSKVDRVYDMLQKKGIAV
ncbi:Transcriptional adapter ADA2-like protein [Drosera capensis]